MDQWMNYNDVTMCNNNDLYTPIQKEYGIIFVAFFVSNYCDVSFAIQYINDSDKG